MNVTPLKLAAVRALAADGSARAIRQQAGLSLSEVAAACGVDQSTVHRWESGKRAPRGDAAIRYGALLEALRRQLVTVA